MSSIQPPHYYHSGSKRQAMANKFKTVTSSRKHEQRLATHAGAGALAGDSVLVSVGHARHRNRLRGTGSDRTSGAMR
eukprot:2987881-Prymnesium_polylepis.1